MKYYKRYHNTTERTQIDYEEAVETILGSFEDNEEVRSMLTLPNRIRCMYSDIEVESDDGLVCMAGLYNMLP
jgi:hypothetical protein